MVYISGLQRHMCVLGMLSIVYFISVTAVDSNSTTTAMPIATTAVKPGKTSIASIISPSKATQTPTASSTTTPTASKAPVIQTTPTPTESGRKFDGVSFVGGIILGVVITVILILAFKWWQSRNKSYHSL